MYHSESEVRGHICYSQSMLRELSNIVPGIEEDDNKEQYGRVFTKDCSEYCFNLFKAAVLAARS